MKPPEVNKKLKRVKTLLSEYSTLRAILKHMGNPDPSVVYYTTTLENCEKRLIVIEREFDIIFNTLK
jgi:hypothetical protein